MTGQRVWAYGPPEPVRRRPVLSLTLAGMLAGLGVGLAIGRACSR